MDKYYRTTYYCNNPRKALTMGSYVYYKEMEEKDTDREESGFVRIESRLKRNYFRKHKISTLGEAVMLSPKTVFENLSFEYFNLGRFYVNYFVKNGIGSTKEELRTALIEFEKGFFEHFNGTHGDGSSCRSKIYQILQN